MTIRKHPTKSRRPHGFVPKLRGSSAGAKIICRSLLYYSQVRKTAEAGREYGMMSSQATGFPYYVDRKTMMCLMIPVLW
jgi:hypothetical protein